MSRSQDLRVSTIVEETCWSLPHQDSSPQQPLTHVFRDFLVSLQWHSTMAFASLPPSKPKEDDLTNVVFVSNSSKCHKGEAKPGEGHPTISHWTSAEHGHGTLSLLFPNQQPASHSGPTTCCSSSQISHPTRFSHLGLLMLKSFTVHHSLLTTHNLILIKPKSRV